MCFLSIFLSFLYFVKELNKHILIYRYGGSQDNSLDIAKRKHSTIRNSKLEHESHLSHYKSTAVPLTQAILHHWMHNVLTGSNSELQLLFCSLVLIFFSPNLLSERDALISQTL